MADALVNVAGAVLVASGLAAVLAAAAAALLVEPLVFWLVWNVLDVGAAPA